MSLTLEEYLMGRDKLYPDEWTLEKKMAAEDLIRRVNNLFKALKTACPKVTSGWRPLAVNVRAGGAKRSLHMSGKAVDLSDPKNAIGRQILQSPELLLDFGLWMEHPDATPGWCHLDTGVRSSRLIQVFKP